MNILIQNLQRSTRIDLQRIKRDLGRTLSLLGLDQAEISILFVNSVRMRRLNASYRGKDKATDVLSFPLCEGPLPDGSTVLGDIIVCIPVAVMQAEEYHASVHEEIMRLLIHGLLHLVGYDHEKGGREAKRMREKERKLLHAVTTVA